MKKNFAGILAVVTAITILFASCGGTGQKTTEKTEEQKITQDTAKTEGSIEIWTNLSHDEMNFYVKEFNKIVPGVKVNVTVMPSKEYRTKLQNAFRT